MKNQMKNLDPISAVAVLLNGSQNGKIFFVEYRKKDGSLRKMTARKGVKLGVSGKGHNHNTLEHSHLVVFDMGICQFRKVALNTLSRVSINKAKYIIK